MVALTRVLRQALLSPLTYIRMLIKLSAPSDPRPLNGPVLVSNHRSSSHLLPLPALRSGRLLTVGLDKGKSTRVLSLLTRMSSSVSPTVDSLHPHLLL